MSRRDVCALCATVFMAAALFGVYTGCLPTQIAGCLLAAVFSCAAR